MIQWIRLRDICLAVIHGRRILSGRRVGLWGSLWSSITITGGRLGRHLQQIAGQADQPHQQHGQEDLGWFGG
jgi:hypothetical protein